MGLKATLENVGSIWGAAAAAVVAGPLGVWAGEVDPPDPSGLAVTIAIPFCCICLFLVWIWGPLLSPTLRRVLASLALVAGVPALAFYLMTYFNVVVAQPLPTADGMKTVRITVGSELRSRIQADDRNAVELLMDYAFEPDKIWTRQSIASNQLKLNGLFILSFSLLAAGIALFSIKPESTRTAPE